MPSINFVMERQKMSNWCWAAVATCVFKYYRRQSTLTQNRFAADFLHNPNCNGMDPVCNVPASLSDALFKLAVFNGRVDHFVAPDVIEKELGNGRPVCCLLIHPQYSGHYVAVSGIFRNPANANQVSVRVEDPIDGSETIVPYSTLINGYKGSYWMKTFYTKPLPPNV